MKKFLIALFSIVILSAGLQAQTIDDVKKAKQWTWFGIDYTQCYFLTPMDFPNVTDLEDKITAWNDLIILEQDKYIGKTIGRKDINFYVDMIKDMNKEIDVRSRLSEDAFLTSHLDPNMIQGIIDGYFIDEGMTGIGLVLIAESYSKPNVKGAYYVTFFDMATKKVITTERMLGKAQGFGLRNYWAKSYHQVLVAIGKKYK